MLVPFRFWDPVAFGRPETPALSNFAQHCLAAACNLVNVNLAIGVGFHAVGFTHRQSCKNAGDLLRAVEAPVLPVVRLFDLLDLNAS